MQLRSLISLDIAAAAAITNTITLPVPTGSCVLINRVQYEATATLVTVGFTDCFLQVSSKVAVGAGMGYLAAHSSIIASLNIVDSGPGQTTTKNASIIGSGDLQILAPLGEALCSSTFYVGAGVSLVKATGPVLTACLIIDYDYVALNLARSAVLLAQN